MDLTPRYSLKASRDYAMNFSKRLLVPKKHFCLKFSQNKLNLRKSNPVVEVRGMSLVSYTRPKIIVECGVWSKNRIYSYLSFSKKSIHL